MTLTALDTTAALVVIDLQKGITATLPVDDVVTRSADLAHAFRRHGRPVALVTATGTPPGRTDAGRGAPARDLPADFAELADELAGGAGGPDDDLRVVKQAWGAFTGTDLHEQLQRRGVTQIVLTGVATSIGVESTARTAHELGYHVVLVEDAMADRDDAAHRHATARIFPRLGEVTTTAAVLAELP